MYYSKFDKIGVGFFRSLSVRLRKYGDLINTRLETKRLEEEGLIGLDLIPSDTDRSELMALYNLASSSPANAIALEIGSYFGASACYLAAGLSKVNGHLYCLDTWNNETMPEGTRDTFAEFRENTRRFSHVITTIRKKSNELSSEDIRGPLNLVFIDGDHSYVAVKSDFSLVKQWLADDGIVVFHDFGHVHFEGVSRVVGEALASGEWIMSGFVCNLAWITPARWSRPPWLTD